MHLNTALADVLKLDIDDLENTINDQLFLQRLETAMAGLVRGCSSKVNTAQKTTTGK